MKITTQVKQDLFVCQSVATFGLQMLWQLLRNGGLDHHGYFINLQSGRVVPLAIDPKTWERFMPEKIVKAPRKTIS
jgi:hypothetical protein